MDIDKLLLKVWLVLFVSHNVKTGKIYFTTDVIVVVNPEALSFERPFTLSVSDYVFDM